MRDKSNAALARKFLFHPSSLIPHPCFYVLLLARGGSNITAVLIKSFFAGNDCPDRSGMESRLVRRQWF